MTTGGWIIMILSVGFVTSLLGWSIYKVVTTPDSTETVHSQTNIDTKDTED